MNRKSVHNTLNNHNIYVREQQTGVWQVSTGGQFETEDAALNEGLNVLRREEDIVATRKLADYENRRHVEYDVENGEFVENDFRD